MKDNVLMTGAVYKLLSERIPRDADASEKIMSEGTSARARGEKGATRGNTLSNETSIDIADIRSLIEKYAKSVDGADTNLAAQVWLDSPDVSFIHPLGHEHGFEQIKQNVYTRLMGETFSERKLSVHDVSIHVFGDAARAEFYWDFAPKFSKNDPPLTTPTRETP